MFKYATKGFKAKINLMKDKYTAATVFLDHQSDLAFIHMQKKQTSNEILKAKLAFDAFAQNYWGKFRHIMLQWKICRKLFVNDAKSQGQKVTYAVKMLTIRTRRWERGYEIFKTKCA